jgi:bacillopeptidase F
VDLTELEIQANGTFFVVTRNVGSYNWYYGMDTDTDDRANKFSWGYLGESWAPISDQSTFYGTWMIRAVVEQEAGAPVIVTPGDNSYTNEAEVTVTGTAVSGFQVNIFNGDTKVGETTSSDEGTFSADVTLAEGFNVITANLENAQGWTDRSAPATIVYDAVAPVVTITSPVDGEVTPREAIEVTGSVVDSYLGEVTLNGAPLTVGEDGTFTQRILIDAGENIITLAATDLAGNTASTSVTIVSDPSTPGEPGDPEDPTDPELPVFTIENVTPTEDIYRQTGKSIMITFDSIAGLKAKFAVRAPLTDLGISTDNAYELPMMETAPGKYVGYFTVPANLYLVGEIVVYAEDAAGNQQSAVAAGKLWANIPIAE